MSAAALARVPNRGGHGGQRLALASLHLRDMPALQGQRAQDLHVEHLQPKHARRDRRRQRERFDNIGVPAHASGRRLESIFSQPG